MISITTEEQRADVLLTAVTRATQLQTQCFSMFCLLWLQYENEGHMDEPIVALLKDTMAEVGKLLAMASAQIGNEHIPF